MARFRLAVSDAKRQSYHDRHSVKVTEDANPRRLTLRGRSGRQLEDAAHRVGLDPTRTLGWLGKFAQKGRRDRPARAVLLVPDVGLAIEEAIDLIMVIEDLDLQIFGAF